jgi:hypothetical protein
MHRLLGAWISGRTPVFEDGSPAIVNGVHHLDLIWGDVRTRTTTAAKLVFSDILNVSQLYGHGSTTFTAV